MSAWATSTLKRAIQRFSIMAAITTGVVAAGAAIYGANKNAKAAKEAANTQARGVANAQEASRLASQQALPLIQQGFSQSRDAITSGADLARQNLLAGNQAAIGSLGQGFDAARGDLTSGYNQAGQTLDAAYNEATGVFEPTAQQGAGASQLQAALSGALGPEAQATALQNYQQSPGQDFLAKQQEQSLLRNQAALGGGLSASPRVMSALQEQAFGRAQTDFDNQFNRLGAIAGRGDVANQSIANLRAGLGESRAGIQQQLAQLLSGLSTGRGSGIAGLQSEGSANLANLNTSTAAQLAQALQAQGTTSGNVLIGQGSEQAQLAQNLGQAQSGAALYAANNPNPLLQGIQQGIGAYTGMGGNFGSLLAGGQTGNTRSGYTGNAYQNWLAGQR